MSLALESVIGFAGGVRNGLIMHPDGVHQIYPLGCNVVILNTETKEQSFLTGHTDKITCMALSKSGNLLATGQQTFMGFKVSVSALRHRHGQAHRAGANLGGYACCSDLARLPSVI